MGVTDMRDLDFDLLNASPAAADVLTNSVVICMLKSEFLLVTHLLQDMPTYCSAFP